LHGFEEKSDICVYYIRIYYIYTWLLWNRLNHMINIYY